MLESDDELRTVLDVYISRARQCAEEEKDVTEYFLRAAREKLEEGIAMICEGFMQNPNRMRKLSPEETLQQQETTLRMMELGVVRKSSPRRQLALELTRELVKGLRNVAKNRVTITGQLRQDVEEALEQGE